MKRKKMKTGIPEKKKNLSVVENDNDVDGKSMRIGIVVSEWNPEITEALCEGAFATLKKYGVVKENIIIHHVPGSFELTLGAQWMAERSEIDGVICLGCVIQGETRHFDFICQAVSYGITELCIRYSKPVVFGVLTTNTMAQAKARAGGKHGNKGDEAAITAVKMIDLKRKNNFS
jgi:6,7-dimethyl-8-ribityllumazine synthase